MRRSRPLISSCLTAWRWQQQQQQVLGLATATATATAAAAAAPAATATTPHFGRVRAALVRALPASFAAGSLKSDPSLAIDLAAARAQHAAYVAELRALLPPGPAAAGPAGPPAHGGGRVIEVAADDAHPDCVFIEDTVVVLPGGVAVVARPGADSRRGEVGAVEAALRRLMSSGSGSGNGGGGGGGGGAEQEPPLVRAVHRIEAPGARRLIACVPGRRAGPPPHGWGGHFANAIVPRHAVRQMGRNTKKHSHCPK